MKGRKKGIIGGYEKSRTALVLFIEYDLVAFIYMI